MITNDYLVLDVKEQKEVLIEDSITAEDAVVSAFGETILFMTGHFDFCYFDGLNTGKKYLSIKLNKVFVVRVEEEDKPKAVFSSVAELLIFIKKYPDEKFIVEPKYLDDPRELRDKVPEDEKIYRVEFDRSGNSFVSKIKKNYHNVSIVNKMFVNLNAYIFVSAKDRLLAFDKAREIFKEKDPFKKDEPFRRLAIKFHDIKNCILYQQTGIKLLEGKDFEDISKMEEFECRAFLRKMKDSFRNYNKMKDADLCIFCSKFFVPNIGCSFCKYGKRRNHYNCDSSISPYYNIVHKGNGVEIHKNSYIITLIRETIEKYYELCEKEKEGVK